MRYILTMMDSRHQLGRRVVAKTISWVWSVASTVNPAWGSNPDNTYGYIIAGTNTWTQIDDVTNDNDVCDGWIENLTWDLK